MNVLLINNNPVVSRLLALCTRDVDMVLEEVRGLNTVEHANYDVVFIDENSYKGEIMELSKKLHIGKKVLLSNVDVEINDFDLTIKKPFLPSEIVEVLENTKVHIDEIEKLEKEVSSIFPLSSEEKVVKKEPDTLKAQVLDENELKKIKGLLEMDNKIVDNGESLSEEELEMRKVEAIKEQLIADGLEIVEEKEIIDGLDTSGEMLIFPTKDDIKNKLKKNKKKKSVKNKKNKKKKYLDFTEEELERIEDAIQVAIATLKRKKMKKLLKGKKIKISIALEDTY